jgi:hypothetical protein
MKNFKAILENLDKSVISEETASAIAEAFESAVNEKVESRVSLQVESALSQQDVDHAAKLEKLLEAIDTDHTEKLQSVVNAINEDHTNKLDKLSSFYRKALNEKAKDFSNKMIEEVSNFLDIALKNSLPKEQLEEAVANTYARTQLEKIREIIGIDPEAVNTGIKSAISEGKKTIDSLNEKLNESYIENEALLEKLKVVESTILLEQRTKGMPSTKKDFIVKLLNDKDSSYIEENFNYVVEMFERGEQEAASELVSEAKLSAKSRDAKVPTSTVVTESVTNSDQGYTPVSGYLSELKKTESYSVKK